MLPSPSIYHIALNIICPLLASDYPVYNARVRLQNTHETAHFIKGMALARAVRYLKNVTEKKEIVPFLRFNGGPGRHAQAKNVHASGSQGRWPKKSAEFLLQLLKNAESNAEYKVRKINQTQRLSPV